MNISRLFLMLLLSSFLSLSPTSGAFGSSENGTGQAPSIQQTTPEADDEAKAVQEAWEALLATHKAQLDTITTRSQKLRTDLKALDAATQAPLALLEQEFQRLIALSRVNSSMPSDLTVLAERIKRVRERAEDLAAPLASAIEELEQETQALSLLENSLSDQKNDATAPLLKQIRQSRNRTAELKQYYTLTLRPIQELIGDIQARLDILVNQMPALWNNYYFQSSGHVYDVVAWKKEFRNLDSLRELFALRLSTEIPNSLKSFAILFTHAGLVLGVLFLLAMALRSIVDDKMPPSMLRGLNRTLRNSGVWIALGLALHIASWSDGKLYQMVATLGVMCQCWGQMLLAWDLYDFENVDRPKLSPLWPMFPALLAGMVLLNFDPFPLFIGVVWVAVQLFDLWKTRRRPLPEERLPNIIMRLHMVQLWVTLLISVAGFSRLAILISMICTSAAVTTMLCVAIFKVENRIESYLPQEGSRAVISSLIMALVMPLVLMLAAFASLLWILAYPGGYFLIQHLATMGFSIGSFSLNAMQIFSVFIAFYLTRTLLIVGNTLMAGMQNQIARISVSLLAPIQIIYKCVLWGIFALYALNALGFDISSLSMIAGGLSVGIGLGMQNMVQNFTSGLSVIFGQTIREGDVVEVGGVTGVVKKINIRNTMLQTYDNAIVFIPNSSFLGGTFTNWTHNDRKARQQVVVGVAYGSDVDLCKKLMLDIAKAHPQVLFRPEPSVLFTNFGPSSLDLALRFWTLYDNGASVSSEVRMKINQVFAANGIEISFPQMDLHLRSGDFAALTGLPAKAEETPAAPKENA
ncbi:MAG: mechanosensitive ion channel [Mailhella sp.]|nr:mechanosensitive ion channel [Mailhella sp.]